MTATPSPEEAREALATAECAATSSSGPKLTQTLTILVEAPFIAAVAFHFAKNRTK